MLFEQIKFRIISSTILPDTFYKLQLLAIHFLNCVIRYIAYGSMYRYLHTLFKFPAFFPTDFVTKLLQSDWLFTSTQPSIH